MSSKLQPPEDDVRTVPASEGPPDGPPEAPAQRRISALIYLSIAGLIAITGLIFTLQSISPNPAAATAEPDAPTENVLTAGDRLLLAGETEGPIILSQAGPGVCDPNNGHLDLTNFNNPPNPGDTLRSYPAYSAENATSVAIDFTATTSDTITNFGEQAYTPRTPWDLTDDGAVILTVDSGIVTETITFSGSVYGLKFAIGGIRQVGEQIEIRLYDISGTLIPTTSIISQPQSSFVLNDNTNTFSYGTDIDPLGEGPGGGYLYGRLITNPVSDTNAIFVQMSGQTGVSHVELVYTNAADNGFYVTAPFFNLACLEKAFDPTSILTGTNSTLSLIVLNSDHQPARNDIGFTDLFTPGLVLADVPVTPQCGATVNGATGGVTLTVAGVTFALSETSCIITATVTTTVAGVFLDNSTNITLPVNLDPSGASAQLDSLATFLIGTPITGSYGLSYTFTFTPLGFTTPPTYTVVGGALPPGLTLISSTGEISGTPIAAGTFPSITVSAVNGIDRDATTTVTITIEEAPVTIRVLDVIATHGKDLPTPEVVVEGLRLTDTADIFDPIVVTYMAGQVPPQFDPAILFAPVVVVNQVDPLSPTGYYRIGVSSADSPNYIETYVFGTLTLRANMASGGRKPVCYPAVYGHKCSKMSPKHKEMMPKHKMMPAYKHHRPYKGH